MQDSRYYFETKPLGERRAYRPCSIDDQHRQASTLQAMIVDANHSIMALDRSIEIEQELTATAMEKRRDNLKITRDALAKCLSSLTGSELNRAGAAA